MRYILFFTVFISLASSVFTQYQCTWFNTDWEPVASADEAAFYREIRDSAEVFVIKDFYDGGKLYREGLASSLTPLNWEGEVTTYRPTRKRILRIENYQAGKLHGTFTEYYARGQVYFTREFDQSVEQSSLWYHPSGAKMMEIKEDPTGKKSSSMDSWHENGKKIESFDPETGIHSYWDPSGTLIAEGEATDYLHRNGVWKFYHLNGKPAAEGSYEEDHKTGAWKYYNDSGKLTSTIDSRKPCTPIIAALEEFLTLDSTEVRKVSWYGESTPSRPNMAVLFKSNANDPEGRKAWQHQVDQFRYCQEYYDYWNEQEMDIKAVTSLSAGVVFTSSYFGEVERYGGVIAVKIYLLDFPQTDEQFLVVEFAKG